VGQLTLAETQGLAQFPNLRARPQVEFSLFLAIVFIGELHVQRRNTRVGS